MRRRGDSGGSETPQNWVQRNQCYLHILLEAHTHVNFLYTIVYTPGQSVQTHTAIVNKKLQIPHAARVGMAPGSKQTSVVKLAFNVDPAM